MEIRPYTKAELNKLRKSCHKWFPESVPRRLLETLDQLMQKMHKLELSCARRPD